MKRLLVVVLTAALFGCQERKPTPYRHYTVEVTFHNGDKDTMVVSSQIDAPHLSPSMDDRIGQLRAGAKVWATGVRSFKIISNEDSIR